MHRLWPLLLLFLIPVAMFPGAIPGNRVVSADDHLSVHHAFQTEAGGRVRHPHLSDPALQFKALRQAVRASVNAGEAPLWNPMIWAGAPLLGEAQSMVGSPVTWIHLLLPEHLAQDAAIVWLLLWVGLGAALLTMSLGAGPWGAATAGAAAMTSPYISVWMLHPHAATAIWLPWVLLGLVRRSPLITALATAGLLAGGHPETAAHTGMIVAGAMLLHSRWWAGTVWLAAGAGLAAPVWMPFVEEVLRSATLQAHGGNTLAPAQLLDLLWPGVHGHPALETWDNRSWSWADGRIHPGIGALVLAVLALRSGRERWLWILWAAVTLIAVTGMPGPMNHARLAGLGAILLAISAGLGAPRRWRPAVFAAVAATGIWGGWHDQGSLPAEQHSPEPAPWTLAVAEHVGTDRVIGLGWALQPNTGALAGIRDLRGYDLPVSTDTERMQMLLNPRPVRPWFRIDERPPDSLLHFMGVRAVLSPEPLDTPMDLGQAPLHAAAVEGGPGRVWVATAPRQASDAAAAARMTATASDPVARPSVEGLTGSWPNEGPTSGVADFSETPNTVRFTVTTDQPSIAVLADAWHPGWAVDVNGQGAHSLRVGGIFRGVQLEPGASTVQWRFKPRSWNASWWCFWIALSTLIGFRLRAASTHLWTRENAAIERKPV